MGDTTLPGDRFRYHAVMWVKDQRIDLGTLGGPNSFGVGVNDSGDVVIDADTATTDPFNETFCSGIITGHTCLPVLWHGGKKIGSEITGAAYDPQIGQIRAFVATPNAVVPSDNARRQSSSVGAGAPAHNIVLPSWVREYLSRRQGSRRF